MHSIQTTVDLPMDEAEAAVRAALGVDRQPLKILGACSPTFAQLAQEMDRSVVLLLPCNVVLEPDGLGTHIAVVDPRELMTDPAFAQLAADEWSITADQPVLKQGRQTITAANVGHHTTSS